MADMQEYKCPCCGGAIEFNSAVQKMKCPYCDTEFEMDTLKGYDKELKEEAEDDMTLGQLLQEENGRMEKLMVFVAMYVTPVAGKLWEMIQHGGNIMSVLWKPCGTYGTV